ncbi:type IV toxin-antitoxin system AbiEi family antitoxin domain-containing protein [Nocardia harenae]|uniref:type IV toxin-antitoxin system AbiEi family antitoxin domain-containing protein n=1 Tax=Nocardia harenae TaxID=358707 RepID=UPI0008303E51|nr:type IV toxin-antitoxin system AbiEi family antitoxin domain-containing protein [Nocardia harenae]
MADATLARLGVIAEQRWGLFTTAQAATAGVARKQLSRMAAAGAIERVAHGVYRMAGAPVAEHETIYATWLALGGTTAHRTGTEVAALVAAGTTAAAVHGIGDFLLDELDFIVPARKGTRLPGVRLRIRPLTQDDVLPVGGLPTLTVERTIADLVDIATDMSLVAGTVRDAVRAGKLLSADRLSDHLDAIGRHSGCEVAADLFELAGIRPEGFRGD